MPTEPLLADPAAAAPAPRIALRVVSVVGETTRRIDVAVAGSESGLVEDETTVTFPTEQLWSRLRDRLPDVPVLRAEPRGLPAPPARPPEPDLATEARAVVAVTTVVEDGGRSEVTVRTWLATDTELWSLSPRPDGTTDVRPAAAGAVGDLLVWDLAAAMEDLLHRLGRDGGESS